MIREMTVKWQIIFFSYQIAKTQQRPIRHATMMLLLSAGQKDHGILEGHLQTKIYKVKKL
jgi:hypothetical protein